MPLRVLLVAVAVVAAVVTGRPQEAGARPWDGSAAGRRARAAGIAVVATVLGVAAPFLAPLALLGWAVAIAVWVTPLRWAPGLPPMSAYRAARVAEALAPAPDPEARAVLVGALSAVRRGAPTAAVRLGTLLDKAHSGLEPEPLAGAGVVAAGLLCAARGDRVGARALMASVAWLPADTVSPETAQLAWRWRLADAAERGAWSELAAAADGDPDRRRGEVLQAVADRMRGRPVDDELLRAGAVALPEWRELVEAARGRPPRPDPPSLVPEDPVERALALHAGAVRAGASLDAARLDALGAAWDQALGDPAVRERVLRRAAALRVGDPAAAFDAWVSEIAEELGALAVAGGLPLVGEGPATHRARRELRGVLLADLELAAAALRRRVDEVRPLPAVAEWRELWAVRSSYAQTVAILGPDARPLALSVVGEHVNALAVWLWNARKQRVVGHAAFRWLHDEARAVGDDRVVEVEGRNVHCGY